jgi:fucose permease
MDVTEATNTDAATALLGDLESNGHTDHSESWRNPPSNIVKVLIVFCGFSLMGLNDSAIGAILPSLEQDYKLNDLQASLTFLTPMSGSLVSALMSSWIHSKIGRGGVSILGAFLQFICHFSASLNPGYPLFLAAMTCGGLANGLVNGSWNAWIGAFDNAHGILGILHGFYALGGIVGPAVITFILERDSAWYTYYKFTAVCQFVLLLAITLFFRGDTAKEYNRKTRATSYGETDNDKNYSHMDSFKTKVVWLLALLLCAYNGIELGLNGWLVTFMIRERHGDPKRMGLVSSSFWIGLTAGRVTLGFVTGRFKNQHRVVTYYFLSAIAFFLCFSAVSSVVLSAIFVAGVGYFIGPIFPSTMILATSVLPKRLHVSGISAAVALSGCGSAVFPLMVGAFANTFGVGILLPIIGLYFVVMTCLWALIVAGNKPPDR